MRIDAPTPDADLADRHLACQEAIELAFQAPVDEAMAAGWSEAESVAAVIELSENHMLAKSENERLNAVIAALESRT
ncbi:hypothetical protein [Rhizobium sp. 18065]|uniref:hypothetical protein n=1 Tax=Rhizobium sp. 18065 TaxID=2681411 RepID=UPI001FCE8423|nr:hypothetical protein [Rhizobium sp. 18065]